MCTDSVHDIPVQSELPRSFPDAHTPIITARRTRKYTSTLYARRTIHGITIQIYGQWRAVQYSVAACQQSSAYAAHLISAVYIRSKSSFSSRLRTESASCARLTGGPPAKCPPNARLLNAMTISQPMFPALTATAGMANGGTKNRKCQRAWSALPHSYPRWLVFSMWPSDGTLLAIEQGL